jgi:hypothetical protein
VSERDLVIYFAIQSPSRRYESLCDLVFPSALSPKKIVSEEEREFRTGETIARSVSREAIRFASRRRHKKLGQEGCTMLYIVNSSAKDDGYRETQS